MVLCVIRWYCSQEARTKRQQQSEAYWLLTHTQLKDWSVCWLCPEIKMLMKLDLSVSLIYVPFSFTTEYFQIFPNTHLCDASVPTSTGVGTAQISFYLIENSVLTECLWRWVGVYCGPSERVQAEFWADWGIYIATFFSHVLSISWSPWPIKCWPSKDPVLPGTVTSLGLLTCSGSINCLYIRSALNRGVLWILPVGLSVHFSTNHGLGPWMFRLMERSMSDDKIL